VILATGSLSAPLEPRFPGVESFGGEYYLTQMWPREPVDFTGKRVAVVGTGSSGIQVVPVVAKKAAHVCVFQRTANFSLPGRNRRFREAEVAVFKEQYPEHRANQANSHSGVVLDINWNRASDMTSVEQQDEMRRRWKRGGALPFSVAFRDVMTDAGANTLVQDFIREEIRAIVDDPAVADELCPNDHPFGVKRPCVDHGYYEAFNRDNVSLISIRDNPIKRITSHGIALEDGTEYAVDAIIYALGYDALSGAITRMDIRGRDGIALNDEWRNGPRTYLGLAFAGFPNLFSLSGPGSPSVLAMPIATAEMQVDWIADAISVLSESGAAQIEPTRHAQDEWTTHVEVLANSTLHAEATNSYYAGANVPGKPRAFAIYLGGLGRYRRTFREVALDGYRGFTVSGPDSERVDPYRMALIPRRSR
jgi:cation diffusion facilitator CzcD-associated flavoprotein CzcO